MKPQLLRRLGGFDLTLIAVGSVIGSGIFRTPAVVAQRAHLPAIIVGCWLTGGLIALIGAFLYAENAARRPLGGGLYGYLRDAYHPLIAFLFGWTLLLVSGTGAQAAAAVLFADYLTPLTGLPLAPRVVAAVTLAAIASINLLGVRQGGSWQNLVVILKVGAIATVITVCLAAHPHVAFAAAPVPFDGSVTLIGAIGVAMLPVLFSYSGFQSPSFITAETVRPEQTIPRALLVGISIVIVIYVLANVAYLHVLGAAGLAVSRVPAVDAMRSAAGEFGGRFIAIAISLSTLGYMSTIMLIMPRVYYQMAADGTFFKAIARISPSTHVPAAAIALQLLAAALIALSGTYEQIINWVVAPQWLFIGLGAAAVFVFRRRDAGLPQPLVTTPGHPVTTIFFLAVLFGILAAEVAIYPRDTLYGAIVLLAGAATFFVWRRFAAPPQPAP